ncbi:MAG TPA: IPT/TIG domain-containing protein, partial [Clostridia bacterium]|nr:IPT/TIG domain-containing protein [Clostridia bacterium]
VDPNAGPKNKKNIISIYGKDGYSNFTSDMRIFVGTSEGVNKGVITDGDGDIIGIRFELPTRATAGTVDLVIRSKNLSSEYVISAAFVYLDIGNTLSIDSDGINPNFKKETEYKIVEIKGRNIGFFNGTGYDKLSDVSTDETIIGYSPYGSDSRFSDGTYYRVKYTGKYNGADVTIIREFRVIIDGDATVVDSVYGANDYTPIFELSKDTIYVSPVNVNLEPNEPKSVDVSVQTKTTIFTEAGGHVDKIIYDRTEEYTVPNGFTFIPDEIAPTITNITPSYGPSNKEIYMTITGTDFQVLEDGSKPRVRIGDRMCNVTGVYDDDNNVVDGKIFTLGTKLKLRLPAGTELEGAVDVIVINPSGGQKTLVNGFEFRNPEDETKMPFITSVVESYADLRGGDISGERVVITGGNIFTSADNNHRVIITIDGAKATIVGKVSTDGKTVTIIPPPGTVAGPTLLQLINEDGSMVSVEFEYKLVTSNPKITSIVPLKGGKGTKLVIKGEDFVLPDDTVANDDPKRKGSVVLLNGKELNAYNYSSSGVITNTDPNTNQPTSDIYYYGQFDPDGSGALPSYTLDGHMIRVQDMTTIYVDIPDRFYGFIGGSSPTAPFLKSELIPIGALKVEVLNPDGAKSKEDVSFQYMNPSTSPIIADINPNNGSVDGGTVVTITGSGFKQDNIEVYFGSEKSKNVVFTNSTIIKATVPEYPYALPAGQDYLDVPVMVMNYDGGAAVRNDGFRYRVPASNPVITSITPSSGSTAGNDELIIKGLDFRRTADHTAAGLPKVYFNGEPAEVEWPSGNNTNITETLTVTTPPSITSGKAEVVLVNYDSGTCIYDGFTYIMSKPSITSVMPSSISNLGDVNVQINGSNFREGNLTKLFSAAEEKVDRDKSEGIDAEDAIETLVIFGDEATGDKSTVDTVLGPMYTEIDDLRFDCETIAGEIEQVKVSISQVSDPQNTIARYHMEDGEKVFDSYATATMTVGSSHLFIINHKMDLGSTNLYDEGILVETTPSSVTITRRVAPVAQVEYKGTQITAVAPPTDRVGNRNLYVVNNDGGKATALITIMSPDSNPVITSIDPKNRARERASNQIVDYVAENAADYSEVFTFIPLEGGAFLTISGSDFRRDVKVYLDDKALEITSKSANDDQLVVKVPAGTEADLEKDKRIVIVNADGGTYDSTMLETPHYIRYQLQESNPVIESIEPNKSSSRGSNYITINGNNFRAGVQVFIEGVECTTVTRDSVKPAEKLSVLVPTGLEPGDKTVQVQNLDFGYAEVRNGLKIISTPGVTGIYDESGDSINPLILSVEGGEKLTLEGIQFYEGIRVIFGGELKAKSELEEGESGIEGYSINNVEMVIVGGTAAGDAVLGEDGRITLTTPKLDMGETTLIVINTDTGVSEEISGTYQKPVPDTPGGIKVEAVDGDTLKLEWTEVEDISYYEIYIAFSNEKIATSKATYRYLGSIIPSEIGNRRLRYYLDGLVPSTWYSIKLRSINLFGASKFSSPTRFVETLDDKLVTFYQDETAYSGGAPLKDSAVMNGQELTYTLGENSVKSSSGAAVNFEQSSYAMANPKIVKVNVELIYKYADSRIMINDKDLEINMRVQNLAVPEVVELEASRRSDADIKVFLNRSLGPEGDDIRIKLPRGYKIMMNPFSINLSLQVQNSNTRIKGFNGDIGLLLKYAESKKSLYPGGVYIAYYDKATGKLQILNTEDMNGKAQSTVTKAGEYVLLGKLIK